jgi:hypothetical protein
MSQLLAIEKAVKLPGHVLEYAAILRQKRAYQVISVSLEKL